MVSFLSWLLLVMVAGGGMLANSSSDEGTTILANSATVAASWQRMLPNTPMPLSIVELLAGTDDHNGKHSLNNIKTTEKGSKEKDVGASFLNARKMGLGSTKEANTPTEIDEYKNQLLVWRSWRQGNNDDDDKAQVFVRESTTKINEQKNQLLVWRSWRPETIDDKKAQVLVGEPVTKNNEQKNQLLVWRSWRPETNADDKKTQVQVSARGPTTKNDEQKNQLLVWRSWGAETNGDNKKGQVLVREPTAKTDEHKNQLLVWRSWRPETKGDTKKEQVLVREPTTETDEQKNQLLVWRSWRRETDGGEESTMRKVQAEDGHGKESHVHVTNPIDFLEEALTKGSTMTPYILPSPTSGAPLLRRDIADSIPMSTKNFTDILAMFGPVSEAMADDIWSTLDVCGHPRPVKGEKKTCATSVESMVEFVASVLGTTHDLRAFSSPDVPAEGVTSGKNYRLAEVRRVTEAGDTVTCHGMGFPFAVFMCHAVNPTRVYSVTLESDAKRMEALAVCHLDTSDFDPVKMPGHVKPGDAPLCHFIGRDSVLWAPGVAPSAAAA